MADNSSSKVPPALNGLIRFTDALGALAGILAAIALGILFLLMLSEVFARNLLGTSIPFTWDYSAYMMGATIFLAAGSALRHGVHVRVTLLSETLPQRAARNFEVLATVLAFAIACYITYSLADQTFQSLQRGAKSYSVVATPLWIPQLVLLAGSIIFSLQLLAHAVRVASGDERATISGDQI